MTQGLTILGATGSIGGSTLDVVGRHPQDWRVIGVSANSDVEGMLQICRTHRPLYATMADDQAVQRLSEGVEDEGLKTQVLTDPDRLQIIAALPENDAVMAAIVGAAGLLPTMAAVRAGKKVLLANKEALVMSGDLLMREVVTHGATLLPIDSEHNAVFQCMPPGYQTGVDARGVSHIWLTASGGPFRNRSMDELSTVTPDQACAHPNWRMGRKISVDSATLMNKGLEVIEAHWLFHLAPDRIRVVVHPQSVIHSMVAYEDGSVLAQLGNPDMRTPIAHALAWPERTTSGVEALDMIAVSHLDFEAADPVRFPCLRLAYEALHRGGTAMAVLNAANEVAVDAFLNKKMAFQNIPTLIEDVMTQMDSEPVTSLDMVMEWDREARRRAVALLQDDHALRDFI